MTDPKQDIASIRESIENLRDERNFPPHLLAATDELIEAADALQSRIAEVGRLTDAARNALMLIESSEFADTACIDEIAVAEQLRAALSLQRRV